MAVKKTAFVTGGTGFVGLNLIEELCSAGYEVTAIHRPTSDIRFLARLDAMRVLGSVTDKKTLEAAMPENTDVVFHVAANTNVWSRNNAVQTRDNVDGTRNMLEVALAKEVKRFVYTSSCTVFGLGAGPFDEDSPLLGRGSWVNYVRTKALADEQVQKAAAMGLPVAIMRPAHIMGKYDRGNWATVIRLAARGALPGIPSGAGCFCNGREVAKAHIRAAEQESNDEVYVLGGPHATLVELVRIIGEMTGKKVPTRAVPDVVLRAAARFLSLTAPFTRKQPRATPEGVAIATQDLRVDDSKARKMLAYAHVPLQESVRQSYAFLRDEGLLDAG